MAAWNRYRPPGAAASGAGQRWPALSAVVSCVLSVLAVENHVQGFPAAETATLPCDTVSRSRRQAARPTRGLARFHDHERVAIALVVLIVVARRPGLARGVAVCRRHVALFTPDARHEVRHLRDLEERAAVVDLTLRVAERARDRERQSLNLELPVVAVLTDGLVRDGQAVRRGADGTEGLLRLTDRHAGGGRRTVDDVARRALGAGIPLWRSTRRGSG